MKKKAPASIFLARLERLCDRRVRHASELNDAGLKLLDHCIKTAYFDAVDYGAEREASEVFFRYVVRVAGGQE